MCPARYRAAIRSASSQVRGRRGAGGGGGAGGVRAAPRLLVVQPGVAPYVVTARATAALGYRAVFRLHAGPAGIVRLVVLGTDSAGRSLAATATVRLR